MSQYRFLCGLSCLLLGSGCERPSPTPRLSDEVQSQVAAAPLPPQKASREDGAPLVVRRADYAITKLDLNEAAELLEHEVGPDAARARARLAIYRADCEGALSHLASASARKAEGSDLLLDLATRCWGATAGALVVNDEKAGVWLRLQDEADRVLVPFLIDVSVRARARLEKDLGVDLPRPLRIDLVRDLFSLSAVSGLPLDAAETTGTVAVARWGRVTMVSPRAMSRGFPWADTLAHEVTHLLLSRATADRAPLWLQEGIAKREEHRWREAHLFDNVPDFAERAYVAQREGKSVGVDAIGPSIAMLPSADAAAIAFAEVTAYMEFWIGRNGPHALSLLLREMEVASDADQAMRGVSGYGVAEWQLLWREELAARFGEADLSQEEEREEEMGPRALARVLRLTELLTIEGFAVEATETAARDLDRAPHSAALRFLAGRAALLAGRDDVDLLLGGALDVDSPDPGWLALRAARLRKLNTSAVSQSYLAQGFSLDPLLPEVACGGVPWVGKEATNRRDPVPKLAQGGRTDALCSHTRTLPVRGSR